MQELSSRRRFLRKTAFAGGGALLGAVSLNQISPRIWREPLVFEPNRSYWARSQPPQNPPLTDDIAADVAVLGGGFTGLSSAYYIRSISPHKRVVVLEAKGCGNGASGRNGAMVLTMTADRYMSFSSAPAIDKKIYDLTAGNIRDVVEAERRDRHRLRVGDKWRSASPRHLRGCPSGESLCAAGSIPRHAG